MPIDLGHGRNIPSGRKIAAALRQMFLRQGAEVLAAVNQGDYRVPDFSRWNKPMADALLNRFVPYWKMGGKDATARLRRMLASPRGYSDSTKILAATGRLGRGVALGSRIGLRRGYSPSGGAGLEISFLKRDAPPLAAFDVFNPRIQDYIRNQIYHFIDSTNQTSADLLRTAMQEALQGTGDEPRSETQPAITRRVRQIFGDPNRSQMIAATEASRAMHGGQLLADQDAERTAGIKIGKEWLASADACPICLELAGQVEELNDEFMQHDTGTPEYRLVTTPPAHPRCMCSMTEVIL